MGQVLAVHYYSSKPGRNPYFDNLPRDNIYSRNLHLIDRTDYTQAAIDLPQPGTATEARELLEWALASGAHFPATYLVGLSTIATVGDNNRVKPYESGERLDVQVQRYVHRFLCVASFVFAVWVASALGVQF